MKPLAGRLFESSRYQRAKLLIPLALVGMVTVVGTLGYKWLGRAQGASWLDSLFMTITTISTIGYGEIIALDASGKIFTIFIALTGIGSLVYSFTVIIENLLSSRLIDPWGERRMQHEIKKLKDHVIIAGFGRVGRQAAIELYEAKMPFVVIDSNADSLHLASQQGYLLIAGDATHDSVLEMAGVSGARGLIATTGDDASNLYIVLSARALNSKLYIVSRALDEFSIPKIIRAGADRAISPYAIGGRRLAHLILSPTCVDFFDNVMKKGEEKFSLESITVGAASPLRGKCISSLTLLQETGANVLVLVRENEVIPNPDSSTVVQVGDQLLALGTVEQLDRLENLLAG
jgi:voltage-gated potassium channel